MINKPTTQEDMIERCMYILSTTFLKESPVYIRVKKALKKLNNIELDSLYAMLITVK